MMRRATSFARMRPRPTISRVFFGEDIFVAVGSILVIKGMLDQTGIIVQPLDLSLWAIPTAILAFLIHAHAASAARPQIAAGARKP